MNPVEKRSSRESMMVTGDGSWATAYSFVPALILTRCDDPRAILRRINVKALRTPCCSQAVNLVLLVTNKHEAHASE